MHCEADWITKDATTTTIYFSLHINYYTAKNKFNLNKPKKAAQNSKN